MKKVVVIGANEFQLPLIEKVNQLGYESHVIAWEEGAIAKDIAHKFYPISIDKKEEILDICRKICISAILTVGSDLAVSTVNYVCENMGLIGNSIDSAKVSTNKFEMRKRFVQKNISTPKFIKIKEEVDVTQLRDMQFPLIVKPTDRSGSRGVTKVTNETEIYGAIESAIKEAFSKEVIIEEYIEGNEYSVEMISYKGIHMILNITQKFTTEAPNFIETMHIQPPTNLTVDIETINKLVMKALDALEIKNGASHTELKITPNGDIKIIEIGARMGGDFIGSHLVEISTGFDFLKGIIDVALGTFEFRHDLNMRSNAVVKFIFNKEDVNRFERIQDKYKECIVEKNIQNNFNHKIKSSADRFGYYLLDIKDKTILQGVISEINK